MMRSVSIFKKYKKYLQAVYSGLYALLAFYILLNTSFLQLSIFNYVQSHSGLFSTQTEPMSPDHLHWLNAANNPHFPVMNASDKRSPVKINETLLWAALALTHLFFVGRLRFFNISESSHSTQVGNLTTHYRSPFKFIRCLRAPPMSF